MSRTVRTVIFCSLTLTPAFAGAIGEDGLDAAGSRGRRDRNPEASAGPLPAGRTTLESEYGAKGTELAGRSLVVPNGCALVAPGYIRCEGAELGWRHIGRYFDPMAVIVPLRVEFSRMGRVWESVVDCPVDEGDAQCWVFEVERPAREALFVMTTSGAARGQRFFATCASVIPLRKQLPPPCDQLLSAQ